MLQPANVTARSRLTTRGSASIVHPGLPEMLRTAAENPYNARPGLLGESLHAAGRTTAVVGNSDLLRLHREAAVICMDTLGLVDFGSMSRAGRPDPGVPWGTSTDSALLLRLARDCIRKADLTVVEFGDTGRLDRVRHDLTEEAYRGWKRESLKRADALLSGLLDAVDLTDTVVVLLSPYPPLAALEDTGDSLTPMIAAGPGLRRGLLTSGSTRTAGIVSNLDIAPSVLSWLGVRGGAAFSGGSIVPVPDERPLAKLSALEDRVTGQSRVQPLLRHSALGMIVLAVLAAVVWVLTPPGHAARGRWLRLPALLPAAAPTVFLFMGALSPASLQSAALLLAAGSLLLVMAALTAFGSVRRALTFLCLLFAGSVIIDLSTGGHLSRFSIMGYSIMEGARYYGIGNEFMGAFLGASVIGAGLALRGMGLDMRAGRLVMCGGLIIGAPAVGLPWLGANAGGAIAVLTGFGFAAAACSRKPLGVWKAASVLAGALLLLILVAGADALRGPEEASHLGRAMLAAWHGGPGSIWAIAFRKLSMNFYLIQVSVWSRLLAAFAVSSLVLIFYDRPRRELRMDPHSRVLVIGGVAGMAALIFNDSGVVAAATAAIYPWTLAAVTALEEDSRDSTALTVA